MRALIWRGSEGEVVALPAGVCVEHETNKSLSEVDSMHDTSLGGLCFMHDKCLHTLP